MKLTVALVLLLAMLSDADVNSKYNENRILIATITRVIVHSADFASICEIRYSNWIFPRPIASLVSISDGPHGYSTGKIYAMLYSNFDPFISVDKKRKISMMVTLAQSNWCTVHKYDPHHPGCLRAFFKGMLRKIERNETEYEKANKTIAARHPYIDKIPMNVCEKIYIVALDIEEITYVTNYEQAGPIPLDEYYAVTQEMIDHFMQEERKKIPKTIHFT